MTYTPKLTGILLACAGRARTGKGTFVQLLGQHLLTQFPSRRVFPFAFANALKEELDPILRNRFGISAFTTNTIEKTIIRPHLVARGAGARKEDPNHWIKLVEPQVLKILQEGNVVTIEDCRYANEVNWVHSLGGKVVYIERLLEDGSPVSFANPEEAENDPEARALSDLTISWPTFGEDFLDKMRPFVLDAWSQLNKSL